MLNIEALVLRTQVMQSGIQPTIKVMTLFLLITSVLVTVVRGITKAVIVRSMGLDDYLIALSLVSATCTITHDRKFWLTGGANLAFQYWTIICGVLPGREWLWYTI